LQLPDEGDVIVLDNEGGNVPHSRSLGPQPNPDLDFKEEEPPSEKRPATKSPMRESEEVL
jgi:hypothetical protein